MNYVNMENWRCMMRDISTFIILLLILPLQLFSQQPQTADSSRLLQQQAVAGKEIGQVVLLDTIIKRIEKNNILLQTYNLRAEGYKYSADAATAWMAPMIGLGTFMTPYPGQMKMEGSDAGSLMLRIEQEIPSRSRLNAKEKYIRSQGNIEQATRAVTMNDFKAKAKRLYYGWLVAEQRIHVLQQNERILETMKKIEEVRYPYNQSLLGNVYKIGGRIEENRNMIRMQEGIINRARAFLNALMNRPGNEIFSIDTTHVPAFRGQLHDTASLSAVRGDILRMDESIRSMQLNIESMKQQKKPGFRIQFDHMYPLSAMMQNQYSIMGMMSIPIAPWASKMYRSEVKSMQYNVQAMEKEKAAMLQETQGMLYGMQYEIESMEKRIKALETTVIPSMQRSLEVNFLSYQENKMQLPVVIDSWEALNMMQMDLLDERLKLYEMIVDYEKEIYR